MSGNYSVSSDLPPTGAATGPGPFLLPPAATTVDYTQPLVIYVVGVTPPVTTASTPVPSGAAQPAFSLSLAPAPVSTGLSAAVVTIPAAYAYSAGPAKRTQMAAYFAAFRSQIEALETGTASQAALLLPGGSDLILDRVAAAMPLRYDEVLAYYYNFSAANQSIDLSAGMSLRIEWAGYQYGDAPNGPGYGLNGYVNSGSSRLAIVSQPDLTLAQTDPLVPDLRLAFDAFPARLAPGYALAPAPATSCPLLASGTPDLQLAGIARRRLRLIWPAAFAAVGNPVDPGTSNAFSCRLIGADTYADLDAATADVLNGNAGCGMQAAGNNPIVSIVFNGRVTLVPEIGVWMKGALTQVPVGTTAKNLALAAAGPAPMQFNSTLGASNLFFTLRRWTQSSAQPISGQAVAYSPTLIDFTGAFTGAAPARGPAGNSFDLPLVKGDIASISLTGSGP